jgi:probable F420-dependent oxidoreductase
MAGTARPFRFGVLATQRSSRREWLDLARKSEGLGFSTLLMPDHFDDQLAPQPALMAAAGITSTLRVGSLVLNNDLRHPFSLAKEAATIDLLSEGRMELGLGAGFRRSDYDATGIPLDDPPSRVERLEEAVHLIKGALASRPLSFAGKHYTVTDYVGLPKPVQSPMPILIGGGGARMLRLAGQEAQIVGIAANLGSAQPNVARDYVADRIDKKLQWIREGAGDRFAGLELSNMVVIVAVTDDRNEVLAQTATRFGITPDQAAEALLLLAGSVEEISETLVSRRDRFGISYVVFYDEAIDAVAPIVARLAGT